MSPFSTLRSLLATVAHLGVGNDKRGFLKNMREESGGEEKARGILDLA